MSQYNERAAAWATDLVMKMDDGEAQEFVTHVTYAVLQDDIAGNRRTINAKVMEIQKGLLRDAERVISKGVLSPVDVITEIAKAWDEHDTKRDRHGRFATVESRVRSNRAIKPLPKAGERVRGIPSAKGLATASGSKARAKLTPAERSAYQQQYMALAEAMDRASTGGQGVIAILQNKKTGNREAAHITSLNKITAWNPASQDLVAVQEPRPDGSPAGRASFDLVSSLGGPTARATQGAVQGVERGGSSFADRWTDAGGDQAGSTTASTYRRIEAGSKLLGQVAPYSGKAQVASAFGQFVGHYGPEAEKVIGPAARKTAYRYRGTERKPDKALLDARNSNVVSLAVPESDQSIPQIAARRALGPGAGVSPEQKQGASQSASTLYLGRRLPSLRLAEIQTKSGKIPPSEGVIIDRDGKIAHQAVGFQEDHYLPFNLKNLKDLKDGQYVRTRTKGGLTTEDIYTGLVAGARQVTVVSNSGVFTIEFEDDFRGVRRYNDKAASMVERYGKTLDAIQNGGIEREAMSPEEKASIRADVEAEASDYGYSRRETEDMITERIKEARSDTSLSEAELKLIDAQAGNMSTNADDIRRTRQKLIDDATEAKRTRLYQLDGEGYAAAMESLKEQYPYYIKGVSFMTKREAMNLAGERADKGFEGGIPDLAGRLKPFASGSDSGYVKARHNRPDAVQEGYYDSTINGQTKIKASETNYQNWQHNPRKGQSRAAVETAEPTDRAPEAAKPAAKPKGLKQELAEASQAAKVSQEEDTHLRTAVQVVSSRLSVDPSGFPVTTEAVSDIDAVLADPSKREALEGELAELATAASSSDENGKQAATAINASLASMKLSRAKVAGDEWSTEALGRSPEHVYKFSSKRTPQAINNLLKDRGVSDEKRAITEDADLREMSRKVGIAAKVVQGGQFSGSSGQASYMAAVEAIGMNMDQATRLYSNAFRGDSEANRLRVQAMLADRFMEIAENLERKRAYLANGEELPDEKAQAVQTLLQSVKLSPVTAAKTKQVAAAPKQKGWGTHEDRLSMVNGLASSAHNDKNTGAAESYRAIHALLKDGDLDGANNVYEDDLSDQETNQQRLEALRGILGAYFDEN